MTRRTTAFSVWAAVASAVVVAAAVASVVAVADGGRTVLYPKHKPGGLACYKDRRADGGAFWTYADEQQRRPYLFHCPSSLSTWCVNVITGQLSDRGCSGPSGVNRAGCFDVVNAQRNVTSTVCLCNRSYCNRASSSTSTSWWRRWLLMTVLVLRRIL